MTWLKWSWRDLRSRWMQVAAIAIVIAFGTAFFSGLRSMNVWRGLSNDASYEAVNTFDLRVELGTGSFAERGSLLDALAEVGKGAVEVAEERLILPTQVSIETADTDTILVPGRLIGVDLSEGGPHVNSLYTKIGRDLESADAGKNVVALEHNFARFYDLPAEGAASLSGDVEVTYVGQALGPEYFFVITPEGGLLAHANFAAVFTSVETAQILTGMDGKVNDLILRLSAGADEDALFDALNKRFEEFGGTVTRRLDDPSIKLMIADVEGDQQFNTVLAVALFGGAVFAAFNLTSRIVDSQRREIGIAMALGAPSAMVALRPMLFSAQVALLGVVFGIPMGIGIAEALGGYLEDFLPLPVWRTPFQFGVFGIAAAIGFLVPILAAAIPVWRGVRVAPVDAIRTGHLAQRSGGMPKLLSVLRIPGRTLMQMPFRNVARAPQRTLLTALAIGAIVGIMVAVVGMLNSFIDTIDRIGAETAGETPDRVEVAFDTVYPQDSQVVQSVLNSPVAADAEPMLRVGGSISKSDESFEVLLQVMDFDSGLWLPTIEEGSLKSRSPGVVIARGAANKLGVGPGDVVTLRHPAITDRGMFSLGISELRVAGVHAHPMRIGVYMDFEHGEQIGIGRVANIVQAQPAAGVTVGELKKEVFGLPGVGSVQKATASSDVFRDQFAQYTSILAFILAAVVLLALLIAYNTASINMDERRRETATMFAYGLPVRAVLGMTMLENALLGVMAMVMGLVAGYILLQWVVSVLMPNTFPELSMEIAFDPLGLALVIAVSVIAVTVAPLLIVRRLRRMDVPSTLRVME